MIDGTLKEITTFQLTTQLDYVATLVNKKVQFANT
jgi:hypothetical protein